MAEVTGRIDRKYMGHLIDVGLLCHGTESEYERLGKDLEEYNVELNPQTETSTNILGETSFVHNGYQETSEASPYYAYTDSVLFEKLQEIIDYRHKDDNLKTNALEVHLWDGDETDGFVAWQQGCYVVPTSYGGDTSGYQIPFTVNYFGGRTRGIFKNGVFTPDGASTVSTYTAKTADTKAGSDTKSNLS